MGLTSVDLKSSTKQQIGLDKFTYDAEQTRATVDLKDIPGGGLKAGQEGVKAWFRFEAELEGSMNGYYKSEGDVDEKTGKKPMWVVYQHLLRCPLTRIQLCADAIRGDRRPKSLPVSHSSLKLTADTELTTYSIDAGTSHWSSRNSPSP